IYERFAKEKRFGIFRVEGVAAGESMELKIMPAGPSYHVVEELGSTQAEPGAYVIGSIVPFEDHWLLFTLAGAYPKGNSYPLERGFAASGKNLKAGELRQRDLLELFMPKINWQEEGLPRVRARLSMLLQRWSVSDVTAAQVEKDIMAAHEKKGYTHSLQQVVLSKAPSVDEAKEAAEVLTALWNLTLPKVAMSPGPRETMVARDMLSTVGREMAGKSFKDQGEGIKWSRERMDALLDLPQKELEGKTPREIILEERRALGNPRQDVGYIAVPSEAILQDDEGARLANKAQICLARGDAREALELLQKSYQLMKGDPEAFRILGNMATAHVVLGNREEALEMLRGALKANPDYKVARDNLHLLESMGPEEFMRKHKAGFFKKMNVVRK
ncbi:MAG: tetratricopeptide repeat protein, partial [Patescibacteria group bacterium]